MVTENFQGFTRLRSVFGIIWICHPSGSGTIRGVRLSYMVFKASLRAALNRVLLGVARLRTRCEKVFFGGGGTGTLVSIIVPTLPSRADLLLTRSLPSILAQTHQEFIVYVVSENFSPEIQSAIVEMDARFVYMWGYKKPRKLLEADASAHWFSGWAPAVNLALRQATGNFIARLDDDDEWFPRHLENSIAELEANNAEFVSSRALEADGQKMPEYYLTDDYYGDEYKWAHLQVIVGTAITWVYRRHLRFLKFDQHSWRKSHNKPADLDFQLRLAAMGARISFLESIGGRARYRPGANGLAGSAAFTYENGSDC